MKVSLLNSSTDRPFGSKTRASGSNLNDTLGTFCIPVYDSILHASEFLYLSALQGLFFFQVEANRASL